MSSNPQWKMFQPPDSHSSPLQDILEMQHTSMQHKPAFSNGSFNGSEYSNSPREYNNAGKGSGNSRFSLGVGSFNMGDPCPMGDSVGVYSPSTNTRESQRPEYDSSNHPPIRETGIIEKLLHSYGFIQCCERQARLFFHFSQFSGNIEHLKIGDPVEFEMTYDRRTGKPIASTVTKIAPEVVMSEARVTGLVTTEVKGEGSGDNTGRISYENRGECFFLPYTKDDVEGHVTLRSGDAVSFQIATNQRGTLGACHIRFENPAHPVKYHGVVCSMKDNFGFIERADVVKEIFFHFSEVKAKEELALGDDVEFVIQTRSGKEVAGEITRLPAGSVVFEDVIPGVVRGQVLKPLDRGARAAEPLPGRIRYRAADRSENEVPFGDKDQCGEFTLRHGDWVQFQLATDRRDQLKRATNISLLDESFQVSGERREQGVVCVLNETFGYIRGAERDAAVQFQFSEVLRRGRELCLGDEVEFTMDQGASFSATAARPSALRVRHLPRGSVSFETGVEKGVRGTVHVVLTGGGGVIVCNKKQINFGSESAPATLRVNDKVIFDIYQVKRTKEYIARNLTLVGTTTDAAAAGPAAAARGGPGAADAAGGGPARGYVAALKDGFGFIEAAEQDRELFFHFSHVDGGADALDVGSEVEYWEARGGGGGGGGGCATADRVRSLATGTIPAAAAPGPPLSGRVVRPVRAHCPDQAQYCGLVAGADGAHYEFGIAGLLSRRDVLLPGDAVTFHAAEPRANRSDSYLNRSETGAKEPLRAVRLAPVRTKRRATVDTLKGGFGFLSVEGETGSSGEQRRVFFHMSEVRGAPPNVGDRVEFVLVTHPRSGKATAVNVQHIPRNPTAARPTVRPRALGASDTPRVVLLRAPRGPDATRGFRPRRTLQEILAE